MGCGASRDKVSDETNFNNDYKRTINEKSSRSRLDYSETMKLLKITGVEHSFKIGYCYISQRGYYPNAAYKANQDSYVICESLMGDPDTHLFGIFDGHGEYGDCCSYFAANVVPTHIVSELKKNGGLKALDGVQKGRIYSEALVNANEALRQSKIDDSMSGTTSITVILRGDTLLVANVGDSRAIIASEMEEGLVYSPLSHDQTPFRKDERERIKLRGGRVMTLEQIEGNEPINEDWAMECGNGVDETGDPPRVWDETLGSG